MKCLLDTSALMALFLDEPEAGEVEELILGGAEEGPPCAVSFATWVEVHGRLRTLRLAEDAIDAQFRDARLLPLDTLWPDEGVLQAMLRIKSGGFFPFADALIAATSMASGRILVHRDEHFEQLSGMLEMKKLGT